jgi:hypothetical protein
MGELLTVTCDSCGEPMVPNASTLDEDVCGWICLSAAARSLLPGSWRPRRWQEPACQRDGEPARMSKNRRSPADLARRRGLLLELRRLAGIDPKPPGLAFP